MKILLVSSFLPHPLYSGGHIRLYNIIKELAKKHEITLVCEKRDYQTQEDVEALKKICRDVYTVNRKKQWSFENILKTGFSNNAFLTTGHTLIAMKYLIRELLSSQKFDLIHVETSYVYQNLPETSVPIVLIEHNIEYMVYKRFVKQAPFAIRSLLTIDTKKLQKQEEDLWRKPAAVVAVSSQEEKIIKPFAKKTAVVPNGVDIKNFTFYLTNGKLEKKEKIVLFIGDFKWLQNRDAVKFILSEIWPKMLDKQDAENVILWIVGRSIPIGIKQLANDPRIIFDESAKGETWEIFQKADVLLAPIRVGGGTQYKILEAMAVGTPVITTPLGLEGILAVPGKDIIIGDTAGDIAENVTKILSDRKWYTLIARNARDLIEKHYTWEKITKELEEVYKSVVKSV